MSEREERERGREGETMRKSADVIPSVETAKDTDTLLAGTLLSL